MPTLVSVSVELLKAVGLSASAINGILIGAGVAGLAFAGFAIVLHSQNRKLQKSLKEEEKARQELLTQLANIRDEDTKEEIQAMIEKYTKSIDSLRKQAEAASLKSWINRGIGKVMSWCPWFRASRTKDNQY
jgi:Skp family chaperone for outer membrane proteins